MAGKIVADIIESAGSQISLNVGNVTVLTASSDSLALKTGSATAPSLTFSGYPTTGLYSPAANTIAFATAGTEDMRIDNAGKVGIGTSSPKTELQISGSLSLQQNYQTYLVNSYYDTSWKYIENGMAWGIGNNFGGPSNGVTIASAAVNASGANAALTWLPRLGIDTNGNLQFNSGFGSAATAYGCRAWVNFNGTGTVAIRSSGNVSSIADLAGTGAYTVNLTTAMPDTNYACAMATRASSGAGTPMVAVEHASLAARTTTSVSLHVVALNGATPDADIVEVMFFR